MRKYAFTLVELLVVLAMLALLAFALLPALAKTSGNSKALQCINNHSQLVNAWRMYADDNRDLIVYASDDGSGGSNPLNSYAWTLSHMDFNPNNRANWDPTADIMVRPLWPYTGRNTAIYKCPSDTSYVVPSGGVAKPRIRSVSMNMYLGGFAGTDGGWGFASKYRIFLKTTDLTSLGPGKAFVFLDERPDEVNWGNVFTDMQGYPTGPGLYQFNGDMPGLYHTLGCTFSFGDGRVEIKRWQDPRTSPPSANPGSVIPSPNNPDVAWLQDHATRPK